MTPGAVSRQVQALEVHLGLALFRRTASAIVLTAEGEQYFTAIAPHFDGLREASRRFTGLRGQDVLKLRAYTTFALKWLIPRLSRFQAGNPNTEVRLTTSLESVDFGREDVDCAIRLGSNDWPGLGYDRLMSNELVPVCSAAYQAEHGLMAASDLRRAQLLHSLARLDDWRLWIDAAEVRDVDPYAGPKYASSALALQAAQEGHGVVMAQRVLVEDDLSLGRVVQPFGPALDRGDFTYYLVYPNTNLRKPAFRVFRTWLLEEARSSIPITNPRRPLAER